MLDAMARVISGLFHCGMELMRKMPSLMRNPSQWPSAGLESRRVCDVRSEVSAGEMYDLRLSVLIAPAAHDILASQTQYI